MSSNQVPTEPQNSTSSCGSNPNQTGDATEYIIRGIQYMNTQDRTVPELETLLQGLPVKSVASLKVLDQKLRDDNVLRKELEIFSYLFFREAKSVYSFLSRTTRKLISKEVAVKFTRTDPPTGKLSFESKVPTIYKMIIEGEKCADEFQCRDGACIPSIWRCDSQEDCFFGDDEWNCEYDEQIHFVCNSGQSILKSYVCDGRPHCYDLTDEENCTSSNCVGFYCPEGSCVPLTYECDEEMDCEDGRDEHNCTMSCDGFKCSDNINCIANDNICDGIDDCSDGSDEVDCDGLREYQANYENVKNEKKRRMKEEIYRKIHSRSSPNLFASYG